MAELTRFFALVEKDFRLIYRNRTLIVLLLLYPWFLISISPRLINYTLHDFKIALVDSDGSELSEAVRRDISHASQLTLCAVCNTVPEAARLLEDGSVNCIVEIPSGCEKSFLQHSMTGAGLKPISLTANAVNISSATLGVQFTIELLEHRVKDFAARNGMEYRQSSGAISPMHLFNPTLSYLIFMLPAVLMSLVTILGGNITGTNIIDDKANGTTELINVSPVGRHQAILSKTVVCYVIGILEMLYIDGMYKILYDFGATGSFAGLLLIFSLFLIWVILFTIWMGNIFTNPVHVIISSTVVLTLAQQASGFETPIESMKEWVQWMTYASPARYLISGLRAGFLKGAGLLELMPHIAALGGFVAVTYFLAVKTYNRE